MGDGLNIPRFRLLTLTLTDRRKETLRRLARQADDKERGSPLFLFGCEKSYNLEEPDKVLQAMWQTPIEESYHSLLS